jgi:uncharacterized protein (TIGR00369 family)
MHVFEPGTADAVIRAAFPSFITSSGLRLEDMSAGHVVLRLPYHPDYCRMGQTVSGQALAALADTAMVCALWASTGRVQDFATTDLHVTYLRAAGPGDLLARAEVVRRGRSLAFARVTLAAEAAPERPVATAIGTFALLAG